MIYIHEFIDIIGHNRARYMHHMTANWVPVAIEQRNMRCFGVWATVGSTGRWPEVVNMWELDGWDGLVANFEHELTGSGLQDPALAEWWAVAAEFRRGGFDRILEPEPENQSIDALNAAGVHGAVYAHELIRVAPGRAREFLDARRDIGVPAAVAAGLTPIGGYRVAMRNDTEAISISAAPDLMTWAASERAWDGDEMRPWRKVLVELGADVERILLVDAPLAPLRIGRQPEVSDRRPLSEL